MCGIAGFHAYRTAAAAPPVAVLASVSAQMRARGPDGEGLWIADDGRTGFAHRRLSIIDLSDAALQPMAAGHLKIVFNGEIYNYRALRSALEAKGRIFRTGSDTEVILQLFDEHGPAMLPMLRGMFAIAIWDERKRALLLARDPYAIKPLYLADIAGCVRFASQVKALAADPAVSKALSPAGLAGFHLMGSVPEPFTILRDVRACPAGCSITIDARGVHEPVRFQGLAEAILSGIGKPPADPAEALRDSVRHHLEADVPVGAFLSGGVDSGAIVGLMRDCGQQEITAATLRFEEFAGTPADETGRAVKVAETYSVTHHVRTVTAAEFDSDIPHIFAAMDQPSIDGFNSWFVSKAIREHGLKVALSGLGGDELLGGYATFRTVPQMHSRAGRLARVPGTGPAARLLLKRLAPGMLARNPKLAGVLDHAGSWGGSYLLRRAVLLPHELEGAMDAGLVREGLAELAIGDRLGAAIIPDPGSDFARVCALESSVYMRNQLLRDADWAGMAHSLEIRVPLVDIVLLKAMAAHIPALAAGGGKAMLANAPHTPLPGEILDTPKTGFQIPAAKWLSGAKASGERTASRKSVPAILSTWLETLETVPQLRAA